MKTNYCVLITSRSILIGTRDVSNVVEKIKTHILCSITFCFLENSVFYEIMLKNIVEPDKTQMTILRMRIACWITDSGEVS